MGLLHYLFSYFIMVLVTTCSAILKNPPKFPMTKQIPKVDDISTSRLLHKMLSGETKTKYTLPQIEEFISSFKVSVVHADEETGLLPLRIAIRSGDIDLVKLLLRYGASPEGVDKEGQVLHEVTESRKAGSLLLLTHLLEWTKDEKSLTRILQKQHCGTKHSIRYWAERSRWNTFPRNKLTQLGVPRLNSLKFRVVGQQFAIESVRILPRTFLSCSIIISIIHNCYPTDT